MNHASGSWGVVSSRARQPSAWCFSCCKLVVSPPSGRLSLDWIQTFNPIKLTPRPRTDVFRRCGSVIITTWRGGVAQAHANPPKGRRVCERAQLQSAHPLLHVRRRPRRAQPYQALRACDGTLLGAQKEGSWGSSGVHHRSPPARCAGTSDCGNSGTCVANPLQQTTAHSLAANRALT